MLRKFAKLSWAQSHFDWKSGGTVAQIVWSKEKIADVLEVVNYHG